MCLCLFVAVDSSVQRKVTTKTQQQSFSMTNHSMPLHFGLHISGTADSFLRFQPWHANLQHCEKKRRIPLISRSWFGIWSFEHSFIHCYSHKNHHIKITEQSRWTFQNNALCNKMQTDRLLFPCLQSWHCCIALKMFLPMLLESFP